MTTLSEKRSVSYITVSEAYGGQRIDNFLFREYKYIPKSHIYRVIRTGELRINSNRVKPSYKLSVGDRIRVPPVAQVFSSSPRLSDSEVEAISKCIIYEDDDLLILNKPAHIAVHIGTAHNFGLIDLLKQLYPKDHVGLVHRLDKDTSGCLIVAKSRKALLDLQALFRDAQVQKIYRALVIGHWRRKGRVSVPLKHTVQKQTVDDNGRQAVTDFSVIRLFKDYSLMSISLLTGRTHQIRVHAAHCGHPIAGDRKYGDFARNRELVQLGLKRIFLHAHHISFSWHGQILSFEAPLPSQLQKIIDRLTF